MTTTKRRPAKLLTDLEHATIDSLADLHRDMSLIIGNPGSPISDADRAEMVLHIHALQNMILAQAAARAYPEQYRLLGEI